MAFLPTNKGLKKGDRIELTRPLETFSGTFTVGHQFTVTEDTGFRGVDITDDEGRFVGECGLVQHTFKKL